MTFIVCSIPHSGTRALVSWLGGASDFRGQFDRQGRAYVFNPGHPPFFGHPEPPYRDWLVAAPYPILTPVRRLTDIACSWLARSAENEAEADRIAGLVAYLENFRYVAERRPLVPVDMRAIPQQWQTLGASVPTLSVDSIETLRQHCAGLLGPGTHWPL